MVAIIAAVAMFEYMNMLRISGAVVIRTVSAILTGLIVIAIAIEPKYGLDFAIFVAVAIAVVTLRGGDQLMSFRAAGSLGGLMYIGGFLSLLTILRNHILPDEPVWGGVFILYFMSTIWVCDSAAYFGGRAMGETPIGACHLAEENH